MQIRFNKSLYSKTALIKAAYHFTEDFYIYLDVDNDSYLVDIKPKNGTDIPEILEMFSNEMLAQTARQTVFQQTQTIRELILGRAFASTMINHTDKQTDDNAQEDDPSLFGDWYETKQ